MEIQQFRHQPLSRRPNKLNIPVTLFDINDEGAEQFNTVYQYIMKTYNGCKRIVRTKSGGISVARGNYNPPMWDVRCSKSTGVELTLISREGMYRFQFRADFRKDDKFAVSGRKAFLSIKKALEREGIDLNNYAIENGEEVKKEIESYMIDYYGEIGKVWEHAYHADANSSFWSQLCIAHPEFTPAIEPIYKERKVKPTNKGVLTNSIGFFQSIDSCGARWANLSKDAINGNNAFVRDLKKKLWAAGYLPIAINTDGIWYVDNRGKGPYHDDNEGTGLGQWKNDHYDCTIRFKSKGAYEFIENGEYHPVIRGRTKYDRVKPREEWQWGDIFRDDANEIIKYQFKEGRGIIKYE